MRKLKELDLGTSILCNGYAEYKAIKFLADPKATEKSCLDLWKEYSIGNKIIYKFSIGTYFFTKGCFYVNASEFLPPNNQKSNKMAKKIIGYKCPVAFTVQSAKFKVGEIFIVYKSNEYLYIPKSQQDPKYSVPADIVKSWEPAYEEDKKIIVPGSSYEVVIVNSHMTKIDGNEFKRSFWASALDVSMHSKAEVKIGCSKQFTLNQAWIESVLDAMERMS